LENNIYKLHFMSLHEKHVQFRQVEWLKREFDFGF